MELPRLYLVRQNFPDRRIADIAGTVARQLDSAGFAAKLPLGARVAIGVGSRGISNIATITRAVVDFWKSRGMEPFLFPAMGSHGAATAEGQADVLAHYGIHEATMGCPVISELDVVSLGKTSGGIEAFIDRNAYDAGAVMMISRVKWHTDFSGKIESGLFKMMAIGLGKFAGAQNYHTHAYTMGLEQVIRSAGNQVLASGRILGGLAIIEDANHNTALLEAVPAEGMERREEQLLELAKSWQGHVPVPHLDLLILDQIGKSISGSGMDTKVVNRGVRAEWNPWPGMPRFERIFVRDLHPNTYGNGVGVGLADVVHDRLLAKIDWDATQINSFTASTPTAIRTPVHFASDRECIERIATTVGRFDGREVTIGWIRNSMELGLVVMSENLLDQIRANPALDIIEGPFDFPFGKDGDLAEIIATELEAQPAH